MKQFTYNLLQGAPGDEQDIEVLGHTIFGTMANGTPPGVQLTNHDVSTLDSLGLRRDRDSADL
jgi:hypothetical protein